MIKKGDFVEVTYVGRLDDGSVFDATDEATAKKEGVFNARYTYGPKVICIGHGFVLHGLDVFLIDKKPGSYHVELPPKEAFGEKRPQLIQLMPLNTFHQKNINPVPGLRLDIDGMFAQIVSVSGGRVMVNFNHPFAGRKVSYEVTVKKIVEKEDEKVKALFDFIGVDVPFTVANHAAKFSKALPPGLSGEHLVKKIKELIPSITNVEFFSDKEVSMSDRTTKTPTQKK